MAVPWKAVTGCCAQVLDLKQHVPNARSRQGKNCHHARSHWDGKGHTNAPETAAQVMIFTRIAEAHGWVPVSPSQAFQKRSGPSSLAITVKNGGTPSSASQFSSLLNKHIVCYYLSIIPKAYSFLLQQQQ